MNNFAENNIFSKEFNVPDVSINKYQGRLSESLVYTLQL